MELKCESHNVCYVKWRYALPAWLWPLLGALFDQDATPA